MTKPVTGLNTFAGSAPPWSLSQLDADFAALQAAINDLGTYANPLTDTSGTPNTITVNSAAGLTAAYGFGLLLYIKIANTTTSTAVTINLNSLGNVTVLLAGGAAPPVGAFVANGVYPFIHDGTNFQATSVQFASLLSSNNTWTGTNTFDQNVIVNAPSAGTAVAVTGLAGSSAVTVSSASTSTAAGPILEALVTSSGNNQVNALSASNGTDSDLNIILTQIGAAAKSVTLSPSVNLALQLGGFGANTTAGIKGFGPTAAAYVDMTPDKGAFTPAYTGFSAAPPGNITWVKMGDIAVLTLPNSTGTSNAPTYSFNNLPAEITPSTNNQAVAVPFLQDNGAPLVNAGAAIVQTNSIVRFSPNATSAGLSAWTASSTKGTQAQVSITYSLV